MVLLSLACLFPHLWGQLSLECRSVHWLEIHGQMTRHTQEGPWRFEMFEIRSSSPYRQSRSLLASTLHTDQQGDVLVQKACSQEEHCLSHSHRENDGSRTLLDCTRTKSKGFTVGDHLNSRCVLLQPNFKLLKPPIPARVRVDAVSITPLVVAHRSLLCVRKVVTRNGRSSLFTCSSVSSQLTT